MTDVKIPDGTSIEKPAKEKPKTEALRIPQFQLRPDLPTIVYPHYTNNARTELGCVLVHHGPGGPGTGNVVKEIGIPKDLKHPLYGDIKKQFTEEEIDHNTKREQKVQEGLMEAQKEDALTQKQNKQRTELWELKQEFLNMDVVKAEENKAWRRKIRKATNPIEAQAYGIACIIRDAEKGE